MLSLEKALYIDLTPLFAVNFVDPSGLIDASTSSQSGGNWTNYSDLKEYSKYLQKEYDGEGDIIDANRHMLITIRGSDLIGSHAMEFALWYHEYNNTGNNPDSRAMDEHNNQVVLEAWRNGLPVDPYDFQINNGPGSGVGVCNGSSRLPLI